MVDDAAAEARDGEDETPTETPADAGDGEDETPTETPADAGDGEEEGSPAPDPATCRARALCLEHFEQGALDGDFDGGDLLFYLEPAGVLQARLRCELCDDDTRKAGLFMTRQAWQSRTLFLSDGRNPERYELTFPKEFGYIKSLDHYQPESRRSAKYPWSKKY